MQEAAIATSDTESSQEHGSGGGSALGDEDSDEILHRTALFRIKKSLKPDKN
jgi:hypothetical protein